MAKKSTKTKSKKKILKNPPVVVVLGHVDHGKTTLLDTIRKTQVQASESGGITQHVGAYQVLAHKDKPESLITFIDTPGHEAFSKMRSRGAQVADIAILVVAANDGVKPQTKEAIIHIKKAKIPFIVVINKIDIEGIIINKVKAQLAESEVFVEGYGGDVVAVEISATKGKGIDQLLEMIELMWELEEPKSTLDHLEALVLESFIDSQKGAIANLLIRSGQIEIGQTLFCQNQEGKVRSLISDTGKNIQKAVTSQPVQVLGFKKTLLVGALVTDSIKNVGEITKKLEKQKADESEEKQEDNKLNIVLKTDVVGTLEAIKANLTEEIEIIGEGVGDISEGDVLLAASTGAKIFGFRVSIPRHVQKLADMEKVKIETFDIIYHLLEDLEKRVLKMIEPTINEEILGEAEVIAEFKIKGSHIAGCKVKDGALRKVEKYRVLREDKIIAKPRVAVMQEKRIEVVEVKKGNEAALVFRPDVKFRIGDKIICYRIVED
jgi:translation initiation factor IF-2